MSRAISLTDKDVVDLREVFALFDKNKDGKITVDEVRQVLISIGHIPSEQQLISMMEGSKEGDGIDLENLPSLMLRVSVYLTFCLFDRNKDGFVTKYEIKQVMRQVRENIADEEVNEMVKHADTDGDGKINFDEFFGVVGSTDNV